MTVLEKFLAAFKIPGAGARGAAHFLIRCGSLQFIINFNHGVFYIEDTSGRTTLKMDKRSIWLAIQVVCVGSGYWSPLVLYGKQI